MNLRSNKAYLAGGMEKAGEYGIIWREEITPHLENIGYSIWNPYKEEINIGVPLAELAALKRDNFTGYLQHCKNIVHYDIKELLKCNTIICRIDTSVLQGAGTYGELTMAAISGIPVYAWIDLPDGINDVPSWAIGCLTEYAHSKEEFYNLIPPPRTL